MLDFFLLTVLNSTTEPDFTSDGFGFLKDRLNRSFFFPSQPFLPCNICLPQPVAGVMSSS